MCHVPPPAARQALLAMMRQEGVPRQGGCFLQIVEGLACCGRHADAVEMVETMRAQKLQPSQAATLACLQVVQEGVQLADGAAAVGEPTRRLLQLLHKEWAVHANEPHRLEPSQPAFGAIATAPSSPPPPSTSRNKAPAPY